MPAAHIRGSPPAQIAPAPSAGLALELFSEHLLEHVFIQGEVGHQWFELAVLRFELAQAAQLRNARAGELTLPAGARLLTDAQPPADLRDWGPISTWRKACVICTSLNADFFIWSSPLTPLSVCAHCNL
jgi:hypothetical protein